MNEKPEIQKNIEEGITEEHIKEMISRSYLQAIAAACGLNLKKGDLDYGMDGTFACVKIRQENGKSRRVEDGYNLDFQLKASINVDFEEEAVKYNLEVKNYNDLIDEEIGTPRILILYMLPQDKKKWINVNFDGMLLKGPAWWCILNGEPASSNLHTKTIRIPRSQLLTIDSLTELMNKVRKGEL